MSSVDTKHEPEASTVKHQPVNWPPAPPPEAVPEPQAPPPQIDVRSRIFLATICHTATNSPHTTYTNADLARELLQCETIAPTARRAESNHAAVQRIALVGQMIDAVSGDPLLSDRFKQAYERLRFTLIKSALSDPNFFGQRRHPLRHAVAQLAQRAAVAGPGDPGAESLDKVLRDAVRDMDLSAAFVQKTLVRLQPLTAEAVSDFTLQLQRERDEREAARRAQDLVTREIELRVTPQSALHPQIAYVVKQEWSAVLWWRLVTHGEGSAAWRTGLAWLDELLRQAPTLAAGAEPSAGLVGRLEAGLREAGRAIEPALNALLAIRKGEKSETLYSPSPVETVPPERKDVDQQATLSKLMNTERWFRVFDHNQQKLRWLKSRGYDVKRNVVVFAEIDGTNPLEVLVEQFIDDLRQSITSANNPDLETTMLVSGLRSKMPVSF